MRNDLEQRIKDWRGLLRGRSVQVSQSFRELINGRLLLIPDIEQATACYECEGIGMLIGLLAYAAMEKNVIDHLVQEA